LGYTNYWSFIWNNALNFTYIKTQQELVAALDQLQEVELLTLDTEFIRTKTYYAQLALLQIFDGKDAFLIDPLTLDLSPLWDLLATKLLVLHAFGEDIELLHNLAPTLSSRIVDTQIACAFLGQGISLGYAGALQQYLDITISKSQSRTDWLKRPLTPAQLTYARDDVVYLYDLYQKLETELKELGLFDYFLQECAFQIKQRTRPVDVNAAYKAIKGSWQLSSQQLSVLNVLAHWRLSQAIKRDMAVSWVVKSESLLELAKVQPQNEQTLSALLHPSERRFHAKTLLKLIEQALEQKQALWPKKILRPIDLPNYNIEVKRVQTSIKEVAAEHKIPAEVVCSKKTINQYLMWLDKGSDPSKPPVLLTDWRKSLLQEALS